MNLYLVSNPEIAGAQLIVPRRRSIFLFIPMGIVSVDGHGPLVDDYG